MGEYKNNLVVWNVGLQVEGSIESHSVVIRDPVGLFLSPETSGLGTYKSKIFFKPCLSK